ncbi:MAG: hypothetical protein V2I36_01065 [Desulfopila sp.]|jgi:hypothetical protein|nr:hypothetical protein [Desulfopila sp.]
MIKKLLIVKNKEGYIRFNNDSFNQCSMEKASVFPLSGYDELCEKLRVVRKNKESDAAIYILTISEEPFEV